MALYRYKALNTRGETLEGQMEAASDAEVALRLQEQGHLPVEARLASEAGGTSWRSLLRPKPFAGQRLVQFTQQLATLLGAGQPLDRALTILLELPEEPAAKRTISEVRDAVRGGSTLSGALERQRDHVLGRQRTDDLWSPEADLLAEANRSRDTPDVDDGRFEALESAAVFDHVLFDARQYGLNAEPSSSDEADYLGLPGLLEPDQVAVLLRERQKRQVRRQARHDRQQRVPEPVSLHRALETRRKELNSLVAQLARVRGIPHSHVHAGLRREAGGPPLAQATTDQVDDRIALARRWLAAS